MVQLGKFATMGLIVAAISLVGVLGIGQVVEANHGFQAETPSMQDIGPWSATAVKYNLGNGGPCEFEIREVGYPWRGPRYTETVNGQCRYTFEGLMASHRYEVRFRWKAWGTSHPWKPWSNPRAFTTDDSPPPSWWIPPEERITTGGPPPPGYMVLTVSPWCPEGCLEPPGKLNFKTCHWEDCNEPEGGYPYSIANQTPEQPPIPGDPPDKPTEGTFGSGRIHEPETRQGNCPAGYVNLMRADGSWSEHCYSTTTGDPVWPEGKWSPGEPPPPGYMVMTVSPWCPEGCLEPPGKLDH